MFRNFSLNAASESLKKLLVPGPSATFALNRAKKAVLRSISVDGDGPLRLRHCHRRRRSISLTQVTLTLMQSGCPIREYS